MENLNFEHPSGMIANGASASQILRWLRDGVELEGLQLQSVPPFPTPGLLETAS